MCGRSVWRRGSIDKSISLVTGPKNYGTEITNLEYNDFQKIKNISGNIKVSLISKEGETYNSNDTASV